MRTLEDLIGQQVKLTFRSKSMSQFKAYEVLAYAVGFFHLKGIELDDTRLSTVTWWQNIIEVDTIVEQDVKPGTKKKSR